MKDREERAGARQAVARDAGSAADENVTHAEDQGEADEPDAPTAKQENISMNTVLDAEPLLGVQDNASDE
jgi:hypothetical protein